MMKFLLMLTLAVSMTACKSSKLKHKANKFETLLEQSTGHAYKPVKIDTVEKDGHYVVYQDQITGEYVAYNLDKFDKKNMTSLDQYLLVAVPDIDIVTSLSRSDIWKETGHWEDIYDSRWIDTSYYDTICDCWQSSGHYESYWAGQRWVDTSHWETYYSKGGFLFDNTTQKSKDLELVASLEDAVAQKLISTQLKSQFSLSASRAEELSQLVTKYQRLENTRELTDEEKNIFATDAFGVSMADIEKAVKDKAQGKENNFKQLLDRAAAANQTTPEKIGEFFEKYIADDLE